MSREAIRTFLWDTDTVYEESVAMIRDGQGRAEAPLLFDPVQVLRVENMAKGEVYREGADYVVRDGKIALTEGSRIFAFEPGQLFPENPEEGWSFSFPDGNSLYHEGAFFIERQISITYRCRPGQWQGSVPALADRTLPRTFELLRGGKPFRWVLFGDSISAASNNTKLLNVPPYEPGFGEMLDRWLRDAYQSDIFYVNTAVGGKETRWAVEQTGERVTVYDPDLVVLAFGMNDGGKTVEKFVENTRKIIAGVRAKKPECEFILVATSMPNPILTDPKARFCNHQGRHTAALTEIAQDTPGVALADVGGAHRYMLEKKRFLDMTSNNVNHPNGFLYRMHAQYLAGMLIDADRR